MASVQKAGQRSVFKASFINAGSLNMYDLIKFSVN